MVPHFKPIFKFPVFFLYFPVRLEVFLVPIPENCDSIICETALQKIENLAENYCNILYLYNQENYNLSKQNSLCFGKISKFPVFSLTDFFFTIYPDFPVFPVQWGTDLSVSTRKYMDVTSHPEPPPDLK